MRDLFLALSLFRCASACTPHDSRTLSAKWKEYLLQSSGENQWAAIPTPYLNSTQLGGQQAPDHSRCSDCSHCDRSERHCASCSSFAGNGVRELCRHNNTNVGESRHLETRSRCPWYYVSTNDNDMRFPDPLVEARCCKNGGGCQNTPDNAAYQCEEVYNYVPLLIRTEEADEDGFCVYRGTHYGVAVGCVAAVSQSG